MEISKEGKKGEEEELCLELSVGGRYGKFGNPKCMGKKRLDLGFSGFDFCDLKELEGQRIRSRYEDREAREMEGIAEELARKKNVKVSEEGSLSLFPPFFSYKTSGSSPNGKTASFGSSERTCSSASDYLGTTPKGGSSNSSDTGSRLSSSRRLSKHDDFKASTPFQNKSNNSLKNPLSTATIAFPLDKPPKPPSHNSHHNVAQSAHRMPCVKTKGTGPHGKTIAGFLYKYTIAEVIIMCICHRRFFTPAEFVDHAGDTTNVSHPLRQIKVIATP